jgi:hypothetical protein
MPTISTRQTKFKIGDKVDVEKKDRDIPDIVGTIKEEINLNIARRNPTLMMKMGFQRDYYRDIDEIINELGNTMYKVKYDVPYIEKNIKDENYSQWANENNINLRIYPNRFTLQSSPYIESKIKANEFIKENHTVKSAIKEEYVFPNLLSKHRRTAGGKSRNNKIRKNITRKKSKK